MLRAFHAGSISAELTAGLRNALNSGTTMQWLVTFYQLIIMKDKHSKHVSEHEHAFPIIDLVNEKTSRG